MDATAIAAAIGEALPGVPVEVAPSIDLHSTIYVTPENLIDVLRTLRDRPDLRFALLSEMTAADFWPSDPRFEVIYILVSIEHRLRVRLKVRVAGEDPHLPTATVVWPAANWLEREVWDMFGILIDGHNDLRRLLMPEDWEGHPARKDYPVQIRKAAQTYEPLEVSEEEFRANMERDRVKRRATN